MTIEEFENKVIELRPRLFNYTISILKDRAESEDLVQDVFLKLWFYQKQIDSKLRIDGVAVIITRRLILNRIRDRKKLETVSDDIVAVQPELIQSEDLSDEIVNAIDALPSVEQAVMRLKHIEGLENEEIASMIGSNPGAVRTALSRARKKMRDMFLSKK